MVESIQFNRHTLPRLIASRKEYRIQNRTGTTRIHSPAADVYSFACFVFELFAKSSPLQSLPRNVVREMEEKLQHTRRRIADKRYKHNIVRAAVVEAQSAGGRREDVV